MAFLTVKHEGMPVADCRLLWDGEKSGESGRTPLSDPNPKRGKVDSRRAVENMIQRDRSGSAHKGGKKERRRLQAETKNQSGHRLKTKKSHGRAAEKIVSLGNRRGGDGKGWPGWGKVSKVGAKNGRPLDWS